MAKGNQRGRRRRNSLRKRGWDYRNAGAYFVTICTHHRQCTFGKVQIGKMKLNAWGQIVVRALIETEKKRDNVLLDDFICMPNHIHVIIWILVADEFINTDKQVANVQIQPLSDEDLPQEFPHVKAGSLGAIVRGFKSAVTHTINELRDERQPPIWQRGYHDRIIRNEQELNAIRRYIQNNPINWQEDHEWNNGLNRYLGDET